MNVWIPPEKRSPHHDIFHKTFYCRVPYGLSRSEEDIEMFGNYVSGDEIKDAETQNEMIHCYIPISKMIEYYRRGVVVHVIDGAKYTPIIYDIVHTYLKFRESYMANEGYNPSATLMQDLYDLDEFANIVYQHAVPHFQRTTDSIMAKGFGKTQTITSGDFMERFYRNRDAREKGLKTGPQAAPVYEERKSVFDTFKSPVSDYSPPSVGFIDTELNDNLTKFDERF